MCHLPAIRPHAPPMAASLIDELELSTQSGRSRKKKSNGRYLSEAVVRSNRPVSAHRPYGKLCIRPIMQSIRLWKVVCWEARRCTPAGVGAHPVLLIIKGFARSRATSPTHDSAELLRQGREAWPRHALSLRGLPRRNGAWSLDSHVRAKAR